MISSSHRYLGSAQQKCEHQVNKAKNGDEMGRFLSVKHPLMSYVDA
jgi:hypothetical protein